MIFRGILVCCLLLASTRMNAQLMITDSTYFPQLYVQGVARVMSKDSLLQQRPTKLPENFGDTLRKYEWMLLQNIDANGFMNNFFAGPPQPKFYYNLMSYDSTVARHLLTMHDGYTMRDFMGADGLFKGVISSGDSALLITEVFNKNVWSGTDYRTYERRRIISYSNGVMVIDQLDYSHEGHPFVFRSVFLRVDRLQK